MENKKNKYWIMFIILGSLFVFSIIIAFFLGNSNESGYNTAIIPVQGEITADEGTGFLSASGASSTDIVETINNVKSDSNIKAVIFEINSPGGSPVATDEISTAIKELHKNNISTVAWIREEGASGAYWIATSTDHIIANRMSIVGSIGVYGSYLEYYGLLNRYNVTYERLVSGEYKDTGTPYRKLSSSEEYMLQEKLDKLHEYFIESVATNRNMSVDSVKKLATGEIFLGSEAKDNGLIDELGGKNDAIKYIENKTGIIVETREFVKGKSFLDSLIHAMNQNSFYLGQGISSALMKDDNFKIKT